MIRIRVEDQEGERHRTFRSGTVVIGRSSKCDLSLREGKGMSRFHCRLVMRDGGCMLEDLGSRNRTLVNGHPMQLGRLSEGDVLVLGSVRLRVEMLRDDEPTEELVRPCLNCGHLFSARRDECPRCHTSVRMKGRSRNLTESTFTGYRLVRKIGSGGMGIVFEAQDIAHDRSVALKVLRPHLARNAGYLVRFIEEIRLLTSLRHPGIVEVYGRGRDGDLHYITMELVEGRSARDAMRDEGRIDPRRAVRIVYEAAAALHAAHVQAQVVHGDVKPGNFLLDSFGRVKLCDFGLARANLKRTPSRSAAIEAERRGTAAYAAPERFTGPEDPTLVSDIYSLGVSLFHMVTGQLPFKGASVAALSEAHRTHEIPRVSLVGHDVGPAIDMVIARMMAKDPAARYPDYLTLIDDLTVLDS